MSANLTIVVGPTSSGKTSLAIKLAKHLGAQIISADSRQIYKFMDIGTGKIPINSNVPIEKNDNYWTLDGIKVWGYDLVTPDKYFSAFDFAQFAITKAAELQDQKIPVILVGGTGFYIDVFTGCVRPSNVSPNFDLRIELDSQNLEQLTLKLKELNINVYSSIDIKNKVRVVRALEKLLSKESNVTTLEYLSNTSYNYIGLTASRELIYSRVDKWAEEIYSNGLLSEVQNLLSLGYKDAPALNGLVYKSVLSFLSKSTDTSEVLERIKYDLHAYIRRQQTYFKKNTEICWFDISEDNFFEKVYNKVNG